jgi:hypothetical protein
MKRRREDAETDSEVDEEAAEEGTAYEEPREAGNVDETRDEKQAMKTKKSKKSKKLTTKKAIKRRRRNRRTERRRERSESRGDGICLWSVPRPSLSPAQVVIIVQQLETESARAVAQQQLWSLDTSCAIAALAELELTMVSDPKDDNWQPNSLLASLPASASTFYHPCKCASGCRRVCHEFVNNLQTMAARHRAKEAVRKTGVAAGRPR